MAAPYGLQHITREVLAPVWNRRDIPAERISAMLGVSRQGLSYKAKSLGLPSRAGNYEPLKKADDAVFARMWNAGVKADEIAGALGYKSRSAVDDRRRRMGLPARSRSDGGGARGGWAETITLSQFHEMELGRAMQAAAGGGRS